MGKATRLRILEADIGKEYKHRECRDDMQWLPADGSRMDIELLLEVGNKT